MFDPATEEKRTAQASDKVMQALKKEFPNDYLFVLVHRTTKVGPASYTGSTSARLNPEGDVPFAVAVQIIQTLKNSLDKFLSPVNNAMQTPLGSSVEKQQPTRGYVQ